MINKNAIYKWDQWEKVNFARIKQEILNSPTLYSPDFGKDFLLYTFSTELLICRIFLVKPKLDMSLMNIKLLFYFFPFFL